MSLQLRKHLYKHVTAYINVNARALISPYSMYVKLPLIFSAVGMTYENPYSQGAWSGRC